MGLLIKLHKLKGRYVSFFTLLLYICGSLAANPIIIHALSPADKEAIYKNSVHYKYDYDDICSPGSTGSNQAAGDANGFPLRVPVISDGEKLADAIDQYIRNRAPNAPLNGMGKYFVQGGMRAGINPLLVLAHAQMETNFGSTPAGAGIRAGSHNSFGRTASPAQPSVKPDSVSWYKWESWEKSLYADAYPASGKIDQPDDIFQYIARKFANNLDFGLESYLKGDASKGLPSYGSEADGTDFPKYIEHILEVANEVKALAGDAINLAKTGTATTSNGGVSTLEPASGNKTVVALDPGHGGVVPQYTDPVTQLGDRETANTPEREDMQEVANQIKTGLEQSGYTVLMLKTQATDAVSKRERIDAAKTGGAQIGISLHSDAGSGSFESWAEVWPQFVGGYRQSADNPNIKVEFTNQSVAQLSNAYSDIFREERDKAERSGSGATKKVTGQPVSFGKDRGLPSYGDLSLMQLWADDIPWIYNEAGASASGLSAEQKQAYATGIINSVRRALPADGTSSGLQNSCDGSSSFSGGDLIQTTLAYAWPNYHKAPYLTKKPEYDAAIKNASANGQYIGGSGVDCGAFVTRVMVDSGFESEYNYGGSTRNGAGFTGIQLTWVRDNWQSLGRGTNLTTADLQPGDVAFRVTSNGGNDGHTFMYIGQQAGFDEEIASASLGERAPMAGLENPIRNNIEWFRKK